MNGVPAEVVTTYGHDADNGCRVTLPDGTVHKEYYGSSWQSGLTTETRSYASVADANANAWRKRTTTAWTQDNTSAGYLTNPRVTETNIYDASGNRRRTTIDYGQYASYGLPNGVFEYQADGVSLLRVTYTDYNLSQAYLDRRIIGLVSAVHVSDGQWQAKTTYEYDATAIDAQATTATMHDPDFSSGFTARGNVTGVSRWDVTDIGNSNKRHTSTVTYNSAGSALSSTDPGTHANTISYGDSFSDGINRNTFAYPTTVTDADNFSSTMQYIFESGAVARTQGPPPAGQPQGAIQRMLYDSAGRIERVTTENNGAYTRYVYGPFWVQSFSTVNSIADEAYAITVFDGADRGFGTAGIHPGSVGGYRLAVTVYDQMGRATSFTRPFEVNNSWTATGDDAGGVPPTAQSYDWQGRPLDTTNPDGTIKYARYTGCGCAGGEVVTLTDEVGRQQKVYSDVLGRRWKSETLNWNGSVYSATTNTFNARDQVTLVRQWSGSESGGGAYQDTTMSYDGYGRLQSKHVPEQNAGTATVCAYNSDDTIHSVTDARGAIALYGYNNRHLVTGITYSAPQGSNIPATPNVTYAYDAVGNRTSMTDGTGSASYSYNQLSQMTSETRTFTGLSNFTLNYGYNLAGQLKRITYPTNMTINYGFDSIGRLSAVTGSDNLYYGVSNYASNFQYRAWGTLKARTDGSNHTTSIGYNSRMQVTQFQISNNVANQSYEYYDDGRISFVHNNTDGNFDRSYSYDHAGRLTYAASGGAARLDTGAVPYYETYGYDAFSNTTSRVTETWSQDFNDSSTYSNSRRNGWGYNADGQIQTIATRAYSYDAAGRNVLMTGQVWGGTGYGYYSTSVGNGSDGDGQKVKEVSTSPFSSVTTHYVRSSVLGGAIVQEINSAGQTIGYVYTPEGELLTRQLGYPAWKHVSPANTGQYLTYQEGWTFRTEFDPDGADVALSEPPPYGGGGDGDVENHGGTPTDSRFSNLANPASGCIGLDGIEMPCGPLVSGGQGSLSWLYSFYQRQSQPIGYRTKGVRWGQSFDAFYAINERGLITQRTIQWGKFNPDISTVSYGIDSLVYETTSISWSAVVPQNPAQEPQNPYDLRQIMKENREKERTMAQARKEFNDCVNSNPNVIEYQKRYGDAKVDYSWLYGGISRNAVKAGMAGTTFVLVSKTNVFTNVLYLIVLPDLMYADKNKALKELLDVSRPVTKDCFKQMNEKFGFTFSVKL